MIRLTLCLSLILLLVLVAPSPSFAGSILIGGTPTPGDNAFPFGASAGFPGTRYQQAYASSDFSGPIEIVGIDFFLLFGETVRSGDYTISLSTITADIDSLNTTNFNSNLGSDNTLFWSGTLSGTAPNALSFDGTRFMYDPSKGNLLLDIQISNGGSDGLSSWQARNGNAEGIFSRYDDFFTGSNSGWGLITQFDTAPEPASLLLMMGPAVLLAIRRLRR